MYFCTGRGNRYFGGRKSADFQPFLQKRRGTAGGRDWNRAVSGKRDCAKREGIYEGSFQKGEGQHL